MCLMADFNARSGALSDIIAIYEVIGNFEYSE